MSRAHTISLLGLLTVGGLYWLTVCQVTATREPWDSGAYWSFWYPTSLALSAVGGYFLKEDSWLAGATLTFAQFPIILFNNGTGPLFMVGLLLMCVLAVPAITVSSVASLLAMRIRSA